MEQDKIIKSITDIFDGADERNWERVRDAMSETVWLDYSSLSGSPAALLTSNQIIESWKNFLPGFDKTHHQIFGFEIKQDGDSADAHFSGKADHYLGNETWTVEGSYESELIKSDLGWQVTKLKFNMVTQSGNTGLPARAVANLNK